MTREDMPTCKDLRTRIRELAGRQLDAWVAGSLGIDQRRWYRIREKGSGLVYATYTEYQMSIGSSGYGEVEGTVEYPPPGSRIVIQSVIQAYSANGTAWQSAERALWARGLGTDYVLELLTLVLPGPDWNHRTTRITEEVVFACLMAPLDLKCKAALLAVLGAK